MNPPRFFTVRLTTANQRYVRRPAAIAQGYQLEDGQRLKLVTTHNLMVYIELKRASGKIYITTGWPQFIEATGLQLKEYVVFKVLSRSKMHATPNALSMKCASAPGRDINLSTELKDYIKDIAQFLHPSNEFYVTTINPTFMKQDRVHFSKQFSMTYIALIVRKKTSQIEVRIPGHPSTTMVLHHSTEKRFNLKSGWTHFPTSNGIQVGTICIFHFHQTNQLQATIDVL
uniref:TF-B3 domain-containing protein n=1 Tax=Oryza glumipatula TaxID=40148 RepID=A0A0D9YRH3_9ORYZ